jgi:hypothetical protein
MKLISLLFVLSLLFQDTIPFKPKDEFDVKIDLKFRQRPQDDPNTVSLVEQPRRKSSTGLLPYLYLRVAFIKLSPEEVRFSVQNNLDKKVVNKKLDKKPMVEIDAGFTDDIKGRIKPNHYIITMLSPEKTGLSRIVINIEEDGTFLVNGEKRGKF